MSYYLAAVVLNNNKNIEEDIKEQIEKYDLNYKISNSYNVNGEYDGYEIGHIENIIPKKNNIYSNICKIKDIDINKKFNVNSIIINKKWNKINNFNDTIKLLKTTNANSYLIILRCHI